MGGEVTYPVIWPLLIGYFAVMAIVSIVLSKRVSNADDFAVAGRKAGRWLIALSVAATWYNGMTFVAYTGMGYGFGMAGYWSGISFMLATVWIGWFIIPKARQLKLRTVPELLARTFGEKHRIIAVILVLFREVGHTASVLSGIAIFFGLYFGWGLFQSLALALGISMFYCIMAGQWSVMYTDAIQLVILLFATLYVMFAAFGEVGAGSQLLAQLPIPEHVTFLGNAGITQGMGWFLTGIAITIAYQAIYQRGLSAKDPEEAKYGLIYGGIISAAIYVFPFVTGVLATAALGLDIPSSEVIFLLSARYLTPITFTIMLMGLMSATMSTVDSTLVSISSTLTFDIYKQYIKPSATQKELLLMTRVFIVVAGVGAIIFAYTLPILVELSWIGGRIMGSALAPVVIGLFFFSSVRKAKKTTLIALLVGATLTLIQTFTGDIVGGTDIAYIWKLDPILVGLPITTLILLIGVKIENSKTQLKTTA